MCRYSIIPGITKRGDLSYKITSGYGGRDSGYCAEHLREINHWVGVRGVVEEYDAFGERKAFNEGIIVKKINDRRDPHTFDMLGVDADLPAESQFLYTLAEVIPVRVLLLDVPIFFFWV